MLTLQEAGELNPALPAIAGGVPAFHRSRRLIFQAPVITQVEVDSVTDCLRSRWIGLGPRVTAFEEEFAKYVGAPYAAAVSSCSAALHLALLALGVGPGDEVIAPSMTYCATVHAILHVGATPVLIDCSYSTFNVEADAIERAITSRTRAVIVVHMAGRMCDMGPIVTLCKRRNLFLVEDCAHAIESTYKGSHAGLFGDIGCFSFYPTKNITSGDGGMIVTRQRRLRQRIKLLSQNGMSADAWSRETTRRRTQIVAVGYKYNMTDIEAALGSAQLAQVEARWIVRQRLSKLYRDLLQHPCIDHLAEPEPDRRHAHHLMSVCLHVARLGKSRDEVVDAMSAENIGTGVHYVPVHQQPFYRRQYRLKDAAFPASSRIGETTLSLPLSADMEESTVALVCASLLRILNYFSTAEAS